MPWTVPSGVADGQMAVCNICHWAGSGFLGTEHVESAICPQCGSVARDRFLLFCFLNCSPHDETLRVLETSPRLGREYRRMMRSLFDYKSSDYDLSEHRGDIRIDLQNIALPDASIDVLLTPMFSSTSPTPTEPYGRFIAFSHRTEPCTCRFRCNKGKPRVHPSRNFMGTTLWCTSDSVGT